MRNFKYTFYNLSTIISTLSIRLQNPMKHLDSRFNSKVIKHLLKYWPQIPFDSAHNQKSFVVIGHNPSAALSTQITVVSFSLSRYKIYRQLLSQLICQDKYKDKYNAFPSCSSERIKEDISALAKTS